MSTPPIHLRPATLADAPAIIAMDQAVFGWYGAAEDPRVIRARLHIFPQGCLVLEEGQADGSTRLAGYLTTEKWQQLGEPALDQDPATIHSPQGRILHITTLAISPEHQNQGLGGRLVQAAQRIAQTEGCTHIILETAHAQRFYQRHGFTLTARRQQRGIELSVLVKEGVRDWGSGGCCLIPNPYTSIPTPPPAVQSAPRPGQCPVRAGWAG